MTHGTNQPARFGTSGSQINLTAEQKAQLDSLRVVVAAIYGDDEPNTNAAIQAGVRYLTTDDKSRHGTIKAAGEDIAEADDDLDPVYAAARAIAILAVEDGKSEVEISRAMGVDRTTIRKLVGKGR